MSLSDFSTDSVSLKWYNIVGLSGALEREVMIGAPNEALNTIPTCREESSDESTLIPSQTSTLTRNQSGMIFDKLAINNLYSYFIFFFFMF